MEKDDLYSDVNEDNTYTENLDCPVCLEPYNEGSRTPKMMPCLHTLCTSCIANLSNDASKQGAANAATTTTTTPVSANAMGHAILRRISGRGPTSPTSRQPSDPLPPTPADSPTSPPTTPTTHTPVRRPDAKPPMPPKSEPVIPKGLMVQCPMCRSDVSTDKLQTNRYVLAHMRDLKRLKGSPKMSEDFFKAQDFWCEECKRPATKTCAHHEITPVAEWLDNQRAIMESLKMAVEDQLDQHTNHLQGLENMIKDIFHSLNKASKFIWDAKKKVLLMKENLIKHKVPATTTPAEEAETLAKEVAWLENEAAKASKRELTEGDSDVLVSLREEDKKQLLVITYNPDLALSVTLVHGHTHATV